MASKYTRIIRAVDEFKNFLEYYAEDYFEAYRNIRPGQGWAIKYYPDRLFDLLNNLYHNLYEGIHPTLLDGNPSTDEEILDRFKSNLRMLENDVKLFDRIIEKSEEKVLGFAEGAIYDLVDKAIHKLKEVITLAENDLNDFKTASSNLNSNEQKQDFIIGIITATISEHNAVLELMAEKKISSYDANDSNSYYEGNFKKDDKSIKIVLAKTHHQGLPAAAITTTKLILKYKPAVIFMVGHQAGNKNLKSTHKLGHILIGEESVDYQQNEIIQKKGEDVIIEEKDRKRSINIAPWLKTQLELFSQKQSVLNSIKAKYKDNHKFSDDLKSYVGKIVSGSALLRSTDRFDEIISQNPGIIGLDMETHGFYYGCENTLTINPPMFASIKSISDFGEQGAAYEKATKLPSVRQEYACFTSANFIYEFIMTTY